MKILHITIFAILLAGISKPLLSQTNDKCFSLGVTSDAFAGMELGYAQNPGFLKENNLLVYVRFSIPLLLTYQDRSFDSWEIKTGVQSELFRKSNWGAIGGIQLFLIRHHQILGNFFPLGVNIRLTPGYHFPRGFLGFQINWNQTIATHISHSQYVKDTFTNLSIYDKILIDIHPKDGWYGATGSHFSFGLEGRWDMSRRISLYGDLGIIQFSSPYTGLFDAMMMGQVPIFLNMQLFYIF